MPSRPEALRLGLLFFCATFAVYAALAPWMTRVWPRTGDEPHYLLAAHSLAFDGDFDLANNYAEHHYAPYYAADFLDPHARVGPSGQHAMTHNYGLSLLLAPAYRLGGLAGAQYFLAALGALLAANVFLLGYQLTGHWLAAAAGWAAVSFTPPMLWYVFLVYPEMAAGLCLIVVLRRLLDEQSTPMGARTLVIPALALGFLPWLSARYVPLLGLLVAWAAWRARARQERAWLWVATGGLAGQGAFMLFSLWLYGSLSPFAAYAGPTNIGLSQSFVLTRFARGIFGWLLDNQRGLFVTAPIYIAAAWGGALLLRQNRRAGLAVLGPPAAMLVIVAAWGGFWLPWEYSARFLVGTLPPLGAGLAYLWAGGRRPVAIPIILLLVAASFQVGRAVIRQPLEGLTSSPVEMLKPSVDVEPLVPAMAAYRVIPPGHGAAVGEAGGLGWRVAPGQGGLVLRAVDLAEFPFGWYVLRLPVEAQGAAPDAPVLSIKVFSPRGGSYLSETLHGRDILAGGRMLILPFKSPLYDGWAFPPTVLVTATGEASLSLGALEIRPQPLHAMILPAVWLLLLGAAGWAVVRFSARPRASAFPRAAVGPALAVAAVAALAGFAWSLQPQPRTYALVELTRTVGEDMADALAHRGQAVAADPALGHEAGILAATLAEIYAPGRYRVTVSLRAGAAVDPADIVAALRVSAVDGEALSSRWEVRAEDVPADGRYHRVAFDFVNPRQQALKFSLSYAALVPLRADVIVVEPRP